MHLDDVRNIIREDAVQNLFALNEFLGLGSAKWTIFCTRCHKINYRNMNINCFFICQQSSILRLFRKLIVLFLFSVDFQYVLLVALRLLLHA